MNSLAGAQSRQTRRDSRADQIVFWSSRLGVALILLMLTGLAASFSSTVYLNLAQGDKPYNDFLQHLCFMVVGVLLALVVQGAFRTFGPARRWLSFLIPVAFFVSLLLVALVRFSPLGHSEFGARRWLHLGSLSFQPSELLKIALVLYLAQLLCWWRRPQKDAADAGPAMTADDSRKARQGDVFGVGQWLLAQIRGSFKLVREERPFAPEMPKRCLLFILMAMGLTAIQPDLGTTGVILGVSLVTLLLANVRARDIALLAAALLLCACIVAVATPGFYGYAHKRVATWLNPTANDDSTAYQITQSRGALASAGLWGKGYLKGEQKINRLPLSTKDFVYPVMVEEWGFVGGVAIIAMFMYLGFAGIQLALSCRDPFNQTAIAALGLSITLQALVNIGTTLGTLPLSGLTLPFLSGGGTSLIISIFSIGLMIGLARSEAAVLRSEEASPVRILSRGT